MRAVGKSPIPSPALASPELEELVELGHFAEAVEVYHAGDNSTRDGVPDSLLAATAAARLGNLGEAWQLATHALVRATGEGDLGRQIQVLNLLGAISLERGNLHQAEAAFNSTAQMAEELEDAVGLADAWSNLGRLTHMQRHPLPAIDFFVRALEVYEARGCSLGIARTRLHLGRAYRDLGEFDRAGTQLEGALIAARTAWDSGMEGWILMARADLSLCQGRRERAARDLADGRLLASDVQDRLGAAEALRIEARLALREARYPAARVAALEGSRVARHLEARVLEAECGALLALALHGLWKLDEATEEQARAVTQLKAAGAMRHAQQVEKDWKSRRMG